MPKDWGILQYLKFGKTVEIYSGDNKEDCEQYLKMIFGGFRLAIQGRELRLSLGDTKIKWPEDDFRIVHFASRSPIQIDQCVEMKTDANRTR